MDENSGDDPLLSLPDVQGLKLSTPSSWEEEGPAVDEASMEKKKEDEQDENGIEKHEENEGEKESSDNEGQQNGEQAEEVQGEENDNDNESQTDATQSDSRASTPPALPSKNTPSRMSYRSRTTPTPSRLSRSSPTKISPNSSLTSTGLFEFSRAESPGPGYYDILRTPTPNSSTKRHSFSSSSSSRFQTTKTLSPGPGYYSPPMPKEKNVPRVSMSVPNLRLHNPMFSSNGSTPGPGTYDYDGFSTSRRSTSSSGPSSPFKSVTPRATLLNGMILKTPGPGFYNPSESLKHTPGTSFQTSPAKRTKTSPSSTPGPGSYDSPKPAIPSFTISKKVKTSNNTSPIGPGFYEAHKPVKSAPAYSMGVRRPFVVERELPHEKKKVNEPPLPLTQYPAREKGAKFTSTVFESPPPKQRTSITASSIQLGTDNNFPVATTAS
eukprot:TRINITY_DN6274_c0_g1_i1.p1 TRINITY_DN6274_c0_g1~~TRINITY_DN6274_c0_g1_i1.p1  ORF type:complete len:494 (-),score=140.99 TRINITY_DN6274_c0_g1_i1:97-1407(-)